MSLGKASRDVLLFALAQEGLMEAKVGGCQSSVKGVSPMPHRGRDLAGMVQQCVT